MSKKKRDENWQTVKYRLLSDFGDLCWMCHRRFSRAQLTLHHVHQFQATRKTTYEDSMILCQDCHFNKINKLKYNSKEYWEAMDSIAQGMNNMFDVNIQFKK